MSVLEDILGKVVEKAVGGDSDKAKVVQALIPVVVALLANGGLEKILGKMRAQGLSSQADSWVGDGGNESISGDQAKEILGSDQVAKIAEQTGLPEGQAADLVAEALPEVIDKISPQGSEPLADEVGKALDSLR
jgi:uncharacterized protein YidB (DUF937 family)